MDHLEALKEIIKLQKKEIERLEAQLASEMSKSQTSIVPCASFSCSHEYPLAWYGSNPPCQKCGLTANVTLSNSTQLTSNMMGGIEYHTKHGNKQ